MGNINGVCGLRHRHALAWRLHRCFISGNWDQLTRAVMKKLADSGQLKKLFTSASCLPADCHFLLLFVPFVWRQRPVLVTLYRHLVDSVCPVNQPSWALSVFSLRPSCPWTLPLFCPALHFISFSHRGRKIYRLSSVSSSHSSFFPLPPGFLTKLMALEII